MAAYYGGVEGGGTNTTAIIVDEFGAIVARKDGSGSNGWLLGVAKVAELLVSLFHAAKLEAGLPLDQPLESIGLCMSGFLQPRIQQELRDAFAAADPLLARRYYIDNDSPGSVFTASGPRGGLVIICGTGSMAQLITPEGNTVNCGGWGHAFGDEASAYHIAVTAIRRAFWESDGYAPDSSAPLLSAATVKRLMMEYFKVDDRDAMLDVFYKDFAKARVAGFARVLADAARGDPAACIPGDALSASLFAEAGKMLGSMARTLATGLLSKPPPSEDGSAERTLDVHGLDIVCVGSVWKSWDLLQAAFVSSCTAPFHNPAFAGGRIQSFRLLRLTQSSAVGAAWRGAIDCGVDLPILFANNTEILYSHTQI